MHTHEQSSYEWHRARKEASLRLSELWKARENRHVREEQALSKTKCTLIRWWITKKAAWMDAIDKDEEEELLAEINLFY